MKLKRKRATVHRFDWSRLSHLQLGKYAEYFVKMEFTLYGFDVYATEVDEHCVDFIVRRNMGQVHDIQVKSVRDFNSVNLDKSKYPIRPFAWLALVLFEQKKAPALFLIPLDAWTTPDALLVSRDYGPGRKSAPEWGVNLSAKNMTLLKKYRFWRAVSTVR